MSQSSYKFVNVRLTADLYSKLDRLAQHYRTESMSHAVRLTIEDMYRSLFFNKGAKIKKSEEERGL